KSSASASARSIASSRNTGWGDPAVLLDPLDRLRYNAQTITCADRLSGRSETLARETQIPMHELGKFLVVDPRVCHGQVTFKGTRVPVATVLNRLAKGRTMESILSTWPELSRSA